MNKKSVLENRLMLITNQTESLTAYRQAELFIQGGGRWVQLRCKENLDLETARQLVGLCHAHEALLCVDDNVEIALESGADAVHLGKNDLPVREAWRWVKMQRDPAEFIIGATANTFDDLRNAVAQGADYIGLGPFRFTATKKNLSPMLGLDGYRQILTECRQAGITVPVFAIGGIEPDDIPAILETGVHGIAISGAIVNAPRPDVATRKFLDSLPSPRS